MKWEEIYDRSRMVVDKAMGHLLAEVKDVEEDKDGIVEKLLDAEYVSEKLEKRKYYSGKDAFLRMKRQVERKKRVRMIMWVASAACVAIVCIILLQWSIITGNEYDRKAGKHSSVRDESDISESGWGTSRVGERVL